MIFKTPYGNVSIKLSLKNGKIFKIKPEYEDLRVISKQTEQSFQQIYHHVMKSVYQFYNVGDTLKIKTRDTQSLNMHC